MNQMPLDYTSLIPKFDLLWEQGIANSDGLSALIVLFIFVIFGISFLWVSIFGVRHYLIIKTFHKAFSGVTSENLAVKHVEIQERLKSKKICSEIWSEFCESLVKSKEKQKIYNTLDSSHFINTHTLASKVTESRLLAAVPGILTAIGVIGTFMGLLLGLKGIQSVNGDPELMMVGIVNLINAASVAFMTSVWGVVSSVTFNVVEKSIENCLRSKIARLQETVDLLYSRKIAEQSLDVIEFNTSESTAILQNLGEDLGSRLQNAVKAVSSEMQTNFEDSLRNVMLPAIDKLVNASKDLTERQAGGSEQALESILSSFMDKFSQQGDMQREMLTDASQSMKSATNLMATEMTGFMGRLEKQIQYMEQEARQRNSLLEGHIENSISTQTSNTDYIKKQMEQVFTALLSGIERRDQEEKIQESHKREAMQNAINQIAENQERHIERTRKTTLENIEATKRVVERTESLTNSIGSTQEAIDSVAKQLLKASENIETAALALNEGYQAVKETNSQLANATLDAARSNTEVSNQNQRVAEQFQSLLSQIQSLREDYKTTTELLNRSAQSADQTFSSLKDHQVGYQAALDKSLKDLAEQLSDYMTEYGDQVKAQTTERLNAWNDQTQQYSRAMEGVVNTMEQLVDDMETRNEIGK